MKKLFLIGLFSLCGALNAFAEQVTNELEEANSNAPNPIVLSFGETKIIAGRSVRCQSAPRDRVCSIEKANKTTYVLQAGYVQSNYDDHGYWNSRAIVTPLGEFDSSAEAKARMASLQKAGYCL